MEIDLGACIRQAFGAGFDPVSTDARKARELTNGVLHLSPHDPFSLPQTPSWTEDPYGQNNWKFQYHSLRWIDVLRRRASARDASGMALRQHYVRSCIRANPPGESP